MNELKIEYVDITTLKPYENNAKEHPQEQIEQIKNSINEFGMNDPIAVWKDNVIIEGHGRLLACQELNIDKVPIIRLDDLSDEQRRAYTLAHNKLTMNSDFDLELLNGELESIFDIDMSDFGFDLDLGLDEEVTEVEEDEYEIELPKEPKAKLGDIYQLGNHRLMCGSSTKEQDVAKLMNGEVAKILFTSPPYSDMRDYEGGKDLEVNNISQFIPTYRKYTDYQCVNLGIQRKNHEIYPYWDEYIDKAKECGYKLMAWNVWDKTMCGSIGQQKAFIPIRHEWIFVFGTEFYEINKTWEKRDEQTRKRTERKVRQKDGSTKFSTIGDTSSEYKQMESVLSLCSEVGSIRSEHPAVFPVGLPSEYIKAMTDENDIVIEAFSGSGTTLIACEQLNRRCYGMELEPKYVDVIINRWEQYTGKKAVLLNG